MIVSQSIDNMCILLGLVKEYNHKNYPIYLDNLCELMKTDEMEVLPLLRTAEDGALVTSKWHQLGRKNLRVYRLLPWGEQYLEFNRRQQAIEERDGY